jgi:hypothetical protein
LKSKITLPLFLVKEKDFRMTFRKFTVLISSLLFLCSTVALSAENRGIKLNVERLALVIGNSAYQTAPLKNPLNDAEDMTATLRKMGFKVILKKNADQRTMEDTIRYFGKQLKGGGVGLFYFAGHGMQVDGRNYLIPIDAKIDSESDVKYEAVDAGRVLGKMEDAENQINIVILDACRNNPFSRSFRTSERGLARMDAPKGSLIAYATAPGEVAADGPERNGIFTKYLMKHMIEPNLPIELVLKQARIDIVRATNGRQIPWESSSLMGDFYFNSEKSTPKTEKADKPEPPSESVPQTQGAAISPGQYFRPAPSPNYNPAEPWTGEWHVEGMTNKEWKMKQKGNIMKGSTEFFDLMGKVSGSQLKGRLNAEGEIYYFVINMSQDHQFFEGNLLGRYGKPIKGKRKE